MSKTVIINIKSHINSPVDKVWKLYTEPEHILIWNSASDDWHTTKSENDLTPGGKFLSRMEAKDGSRGFDFAGIYTGVEFCKSIVYTLGDGRKVEVSFSGEGDKTEMEIQFEAEGEFSPEMQRSGWQSILNNFKKYTEDYNL